MSDPAREEGRPFERVYTVFDYYDSPRVGFADFDGAPHVYRSIFREDLDDWDPEGRFELSPVSPELLALALEDWAIWLHWADAYSANQTSLETHPALPADRARHEEIRPAFERSMEIDPAQRRVAVGEFRRRGGVPGRRTPPHLEVWEVQWTPAE